MVGGSGVFNKVVYKVFPEGVCEVFNEVVCAETIDLGGEYVRGGSLYSIRTVQIGSAACIRQ